MKKTQLLADALISEADLIFTLDFNALHRCGAMEAPIENAPLLKL